MLEYLLEYLVLLLQGLLLLVLYLLLTRLFPQGRAGEDSTHVSLHASPRICKLTYTTEMAIQRQKVNKAFGDFSDILSKH